MSKEVKFVVDFLDWKKGKKVALQSKRAEQYLKLGVAVDPKAPKPKAAKAPANKMVKEAAVNK